jgi:predicted Abi (CAAX) family protease
MTLTVLDRFWEILGWVFVLKDEVFRRVATSSGGIWFAIFVVLLAQLSLSIGQSIVLFINRVQPIRFIFSLLISAVLYLFEFLFLVLSTWLICLLPGAVRLSLPTLFIVLGLGYAPLLFSVLGALPYLGFPLLRILSIWNLLAMVVGFGAVANLGIGSAFWYVAFGWFVKELLEHTIGQPIAKFGRLLAERVAGVHLAIRRAELTELLQSGFETRFSQIDASLQEMGSSAAGSFQSAQPIEPPSVQSEVNSSEVNPVATESTLATPLDFAAAQPDSIDTNRSRLRLTHQLRKIPQVIRLGLIVLGLIVLFLMIAILLRPVRLTLFSWYGGLPWLLRRVFDLSWVGILAIIFAGLLAPLEALGWWAGWYGDGLDMDTARSISAVPASQQQAQQQNPSGEPPARYVVYVDGVGQSGEEYTPDVVEFLCALRAVLPKEMEFVQGLMLYSVFNQPLIQDRPLARIWRLADRVRWQNPAALLGLMVNLRNAWIVAVSADKRYGPIYNQGIAQVLYNGLMRHGYDPDDGTPITFIGYSGGAQMSVAAAPYLRRVLDSEIEVISLGGVMSANNNFLQLGQLYHLVGQQDTVTRLGSILFPGRWPLFPLSYWNRAKRKGKISQVSLGPMGHQVPGGMMDPDAILPNGKTNLQQTISVILSILEGRFLVAKPHRPKQITNYERYLQADFNHPAYYPLTQTVDSQWYRPIAPWMGRLILPAFSDRRQVRGVWFEVHHAERGYESWVGQTVMLRWLDEPGVKQRVRAVTRDVHFSADAEYSSQQGESIHPERINHWQRVGPLESLAGSHPTDDLIVMLAGEVKVEAGEPQILRITHQPVEISGRYYGLVRFEAAITGTDSFQVRHFNPNSRQFDGAVEKVRLPPVLLAHVYGSYPSTTHRLEQSPLNETGWYIYGAKDAAGRFVVQALAPRALFRLQPDRVIFGRKASYRYIRQEAWANAAAQKGNISSVLCVGNPEIDQIQPAIDQWKVGDRALLLHVYGGIGGNKKEPAAATPIFFGHFAYGLATVIHDPLSDERRFEIQYYQVYSHNTDGITAGTLHWSRYMGNRQFGWLGNRPTCDILIKFEPFTGFFDINGAHRSALTNMLTQLEAMTARYRIGDGTGATYVGPANNCAQDSNQALFASIDSLFQAIATHQSVLQAWIANNPTQSQRYHQLLNVQAKLYQKLQPLGFLREDWKRNEFNLGSTLEDEPLRNLWTGLGSWRTLLPRKASDMVVQVFLDQGAAVWVLRTNQVGGYDPDIEPISPMTL